MEGDVLEFGKAERGGVRPDLLQEDIDLIPDQTAPSCSDGGSWFDHTTKAGYQRGMHPMPWV
jgi:hypothetical protein